MILDKQEKHFNIAGWNLFLKRETKLIKSLSLKGVVEN